MHPIPAKSCSSVPKWTRAILKSGVLDNGVLLGTVVFSRLRTDTPGFNVAIGRPAEFASFVTIQGAVLEAQQGEVVFDPVSPTRDDQDLDGLQDRWEEQYFKDPKEVFYSDDNDGDGVNAQGEEALGSDPTDAASNLHLEVVHKADGVLLSWTSFEGRTYTIEAGEDMHRFRAVESGLKATPPSNTYELKPETKSNVQFFRILLEPAGR